MKELAEAGFTFSIDDYGSGFAAADHLYRLPIRLVKLDRTIIWEAMKDPQAMTVFRHIISMAKDLGKEIVVEGAETSSMVRTIEEAGADYIQGFYFSRPLPEDRLAALLKESRPVSGAD